MLSVTAGNAAGPGKPVEPYESPAPPAWSLPSVPGPHEATVVPVPEAPIAIVDAEPVPLPVEVEAAAVGAVVPLPPAPLIVMAGPETLARAEVKYGLPRGLLLAVAIHESGAGKKACAPHNAWGVMEWVPERRCRSFGSWEESTDYVAGALAGWIARYGLEGGLSVWNTGTPVDGLGYAAVVLHTLAGME